MTRIANQKEAVWMTEETLDASEIVDGDVPENPHNNTSITWKTSNC